jgi:hypothetical protein
MAEVLEIHVDQIERYGGDWLLREKRRRYRADVDAHVATNAGRLGGRARRNAEISR